VEAGPKGAVVTLRNNEFPNPAGLVAMVTDPGMAVRLKPDQKLVFVRDWPNPEARLKGTAAILSRMARLAEASSAPATLAG
jgi:transcription-repair coupling factor (superfamily II helicase)